MPMNKVLLEYSLVRSLLYFPCSGDSSCDGEQMAGKAKNTHYLALRRKNWLTLVWNNSNFGLWGSLCSKTPAGGFSQLLTVCFCCWNKWSIYFAWLGGLIKETFLCPLFFCFSISRQKSPKEISHMAYPFASGMIM